MTGYGKKNSNIDVYKKRIGRTKVFRFHYWYEALLLWHCLEHVHECGDVGYGDVSIAVDVDDRHWVASLADVAHDNVGQCGYVSEVHIAIAIQVKTRP